MGARAACLHATTRARRDAARRRSPNFRSTASASRFRCMRSTWCSRPRTGCRSSTATATTSRRIFARPRSCWIRFRRTTPSRCSQKHRVRYIGIHWDMYGPRAEEISDRSSRLRAVPAAARQRCDDDALRDRVVSLRALYVCRWRGLVARLAGVLLLGGRASLRAAPSSWRRASSAGFGVGAFAGGERSESRARDAAAVARRDGGSPPPCPGSASRSSASRGTGCRR